MITFVRKHRSLRVMLGIALAILVIVLVRWRIVNSSLGPRQFVQTQGTIDSIRFSHDGRLVMTTDAVDREVAFRDAVDGRIVRQWAYDGGETWLSKDGARVLATKYSADSPSRSTLYDAITGRVLRRWDGQVLDVLPDFSMMVIANDYLLQSAAKASVRQPIKKNAKPASAPGEGRLVEVATGKVLGEIPVVSFYNTRLSRDGHYLCVANGDKPALLLHVPEMTPVFSAPPLFSLRVSRDGRRALGADNKTGMLHLWLLPSGVHTTVETGLNQVRWVYSLDDGSVVVEGSEGSRFHSHTTVQVRSENGERLLRSLPMDPEAYSSDTRFIGSTDWNGRGSDAFNVFDIQTGRRVVRLNTTVDALGQSVSQRGYGGERFAIAPDGRRFASAGRGGLLRLYDLGAPAPPATHSPVSTDSGRVVMSHENEGGGVAFFDAVALPGGGVTIQERRRDAWDRIDGLSAVIPREQIVGGHRYQAAQFAISPDGKVTAVLWNGLKHQFVDGKRSDMILEDGLMELRDTRSGRLIRTLVSTNQDGGRLSYWGALGAPVFSLDGKQLAAADDRGVAVIFDVASGRKIGQLSGTRVLNTSYMGAFVSNMAGDAATLAFSPDGRFLAAGRDDGSIYLYSLRTFLPVAQIGQVAAYPSANYGKLSRPLQSIAFDARGDKLYGVPQFGADVLTWDVPKL